MFDQTKRVIIDGIERRSDDIETPRRQPQPQVVRSAAVPATKAVLFSLVFSAFPRTGDRRAAFFREARRPMPPRHMAPLH
jgi:hypothetical protein